MTIWILALVLLASGAGLGLRQGAIRVAISFVGIVAAVFFAGLSGRLFKPLLPHVGIHNPILIWLLAPFIAYIVILILFKIAAFLVHRKVELFYKYKAGDLRLALWRRLNSRLGLCIGLLNGTAYLVLIAFVIFNISYWTIQMAPSDNEPFMIRLVNRMGNDLQATGLSSAARSVIRFPEMYYRLADLAGLLRQNPQLRSRLERYPAFLSLAERDDFKQLGKDNDFQSAWQSRASTSKLLGNSQVKAMLKDNELTTKILGIVQANWDDLNEYLKTGKSPKYDSDKLLGRWDFNVNVSVGMLLIAHPKIRPEEIKALRSLWSDAYAQTVFVAAPDHQAFLENVPRFTVQKGVTTVAERQNFQGQWEKGDTNYEISLNGNGRSLSITARSDGLRLTLKSDNDVWVFNHE